MYKGQIIVARTYMFFIFPYLILKYLEKNYIPSTSSNNTLVYTMSFCFHRQLQSFVVLKLKWSWLLHSWFAINHLEKFICRYDMNSNIYLPEDETTSELFPFFKFEKDPLLFVPWNDTRNFSLDRLFSAAKRFLIWFTKISITVVNCSYFSQFSWYFLLWDIASAKAVWFRLSWKNFNDLTNVMFKKLLKKHGSFLTSTLKM